jgi:hypothetical protein
MEIIIEDGELFRMIKEKNLKKNKKLEEKSIKE